MVDKNPAATDFMLWPLVAGEMAMSASLFAARMLQIGLESADTAVAKYIELTEQEMKRAQKRESVKVE
ncbi:hypothetical protein [Nitrososphaera sp.]|uniref:hypothetical protein n=1 Tax=Nitrososphaera sp. TaxID=1971748 RepID=UPI002ED815DE